MTTTRRDLLGAGASAALSLLPLDNTTTFFARASPVAGSLTSQTWDDGELAHVLPTSSHNRILIRQRQLFVLVISAFRAFDRIHVGPFGNSMLAI